MKKVLCVIYFVSFFYTCSSGNVKQQEVPSGFNFASYLPSSFEEIIKLTDGVDAEKDHGLSIFTNKYRIQMKWTEFPKGISKESLGSAQVLSKFINLDPRYVALFKYELKMKVKNKSFTLLFQENLVPFLHQEVKKGDSIALFVFFGEYNTFGKEHVLFVNEFQTGTK
ncbi:hypothetical protein [Leptospira andrefontaineae]|uniref:Uncharacterized protein n=1 Tax=Leptospira andrefontaineae TaxID=2484976 RepID=A0A4R9HAD3_9LEPT|nr:hypothetical protein [Leptospira andrefontaineae]TGK43478.1 hypothetical protein EHO65_02225 [Leptospira andrefontaineae]